MNPSFLKTSPPKKKISACEADKAFTLIEILVVVAILGVLAALLFPAVSSVISKAKTAKTISNLKQLQTANINFAGDNNGTFVKAFNGGSWSDGWKWNPTFLSYIGAKPTGTAADASPLFRSGFPQSGARIAYNCSKVPSPSGSGYVYYWSSPSPANGNPVNLALRQSQVQQPTKTIAFIDATDWWVNPDTWNTWVSAAANDRTGTPAACVAYRNNGKAAAVTYAGNAVMLNRADLNTSTTDGRWRWWYDGRP